MKLERRSDHIKILESDSYILSKNAAYQCQNCKERNYMIKKTGDDNNLFCTNCGYQTPLRTIKHSRGLAAPSIQQQTVIIKPEKEVKASERKPIGINRKKNLLEQSLIEKGFQLIESDTIEREQR